jgi:hypothetical protein
MAARLLVKSLRLGESYGHGGAPMAGQRAPQISPGKSPRAAANQGR